MSGATPLWLLDSRNVFKPFSSAPKATSAEFGKMHKKMNRRKQKMLTI